MVLKSGDVLESTQRICTTQRIGSVPRISPRESNSISLDGKIEFTHLTTTLGFFFFFLYTFRRLYFEKWNKSNHFFGSVYQIW